MNFQGRQEAKNTGARPAAHSMYAKSGAVGLVDNRPITPLQRKLLDHADEPPPQPIQKRINNTGLPDRLKSGMENLSGYSMDDVNVHYNSSKPAQLKAHAYAQGTDIHLASGQERHLPHEAWHIVQQKQGRVRPTLQLKAGVNINDDQGLEKEADEMGSKALQSGSVIQNKKNSSQQFSDTIQLQTEINYHAGEFNYVDSKTHKAEKEVVGHKMVAKLDPGDEIKGSEPGSGVQVGIMTSLKDNGYKRMIRGHLMNGQMGGLGIAANLFPITAHANSKHKSYMENYVKGQLHVESKKAHPDDIDYQVTVVPTSHPKDVGWSPINVEFQCKASTVGGWAHNIDIGSNPTKDAANQGLEGTPTIKPAIAGTAENRPPGKWGQASNGYDPSNADHLLSASRSKFSWKGQHDMHPDVNLYAHGLHFDAGTIDAKKIEAFELFWKLETIKSPVTIGMTTFTEAMIEGMNDGQLDVVIDLFKKEIAKKDNLKGDWKSTAIQYAKDNPKTATLGGLAAILGVSVLVLALWYYPLYTILGMGVSALSGYKLSGGKLKMS